MRTADAGRSLTGRDELNWASFTTNFRPPSALRSLEREHSCEWILKDSEPTPIADDALRWNLRLIYQNRPRATSAQYGKKTEEAN